MFVRFTFVVKYSNVKCLKFWWKYCEYCFDCFLLAGGDKVGSLGDVEFTLVCCGSLADSLLQMSFVLALLWLNHWIQFKKVPHFLWLLYDHCVVCVVYVLCCCVFVYSVCRPKLVVNICINWLPIIVNLSVILSSQYSLNLFLFFNKCKKTRQKRENKLDCCC